MVYIPCFFRKWPEGVLPGHGPLTAADGMGVSLHLLLWSKFKRRTPYDFYTNAGEQQASEFGVGI